MWQKILERVRRTPASDPPQPIPDLDQAQQILEDFSLFWQNEQDPNAKRRFLSLIFQGIWIDEHRIVAVQPKRSFLPFFENQHQTATAGAGVKYGSDGGRTRCGHRIEIRL